MLIIVWSEIAKCEWNPAPMATPRHCSHSKISWDEIKLINWWCCFDLFIQYFLDVHITMREKNEPKRYKKLDGIFHPSWHIFVFFLENYFIQKWAWSKDHLNGGTQAIKGSVKNLRVFWANGDFGVQYSSEPSSLEKMREKWEFSLWQRGRRFSEMSLSASREPGTRCSKSPQLRKARSTRSCGGAFPNLHVLFDAGEGGLFRIVSQRIKIVHSHENSYHDFTRRWVFARTHTGVKITCLVFRV